MAAKLNRTISKQTIKQTINLQDEFGLDFSGKKKLREKIGELFIERIRERTAKSKDINGKPLKAPYSKAYKKSKEFKKYGKTNTVNMKLKGNMLDSISTRSKDANTIELYVPKGENNKKAFNHIVGDTLPKRDFFGVSKGEIRSVGKAIKRELNDVKEETELKPSASVADVFETKIGKDAIADFIDWLVEK